MTSTYHSRSHDVFTPWHRVCHVGWLDPRFALAIPECHVGPCLADGGAVHGGCVMRASTWMVLCSLACSIAPAGCGGEAEGTSGGPGGENQDSGLQEAGGQDAAPEAGEDAPPEVGQDTGQADCPTNPDPSIMGTPCTGPDRTCGTCPPDPCSFCNLLRCEGGTWTGVEAFPDPSCLDPTNDPFACGSATCQPGEYCFATGCGVDGCSPPPPECRPIPDGCQMCACLSPNSSCLCEQDSSGGVYVDCPGA